MSKVSNISTAYRNALDVGRDQYNQLVVERRAAAEDFYSQFLSTQIVNFRNRFSSKRRRQQLQERIARALGTRRLQFIAIDGTCRKEQYSDMLTFFGGAYGARGELELVDGDHKVRYKRWRLDQDVSMVAWIPVPFARLEEIQPQGEQFLATNDEIADIAHVHTQIMQLSELFLAINTITASVIDAPNLILMDLSPSSVLASVAQKQSNIGLVGYPYDRRCLTEADIAVAYAHPVNETFGIPSDKKMDRHRRIIASLLREPTQRINPQMNWSPLEEILDQNGVPLINVRESWDYTKALFQNICKRLFLEKDPTALQYDAEDESGVMRKRWMSSDDLKFLTAVGIRMLIEECWNRNVLLYGIVKDSASRYFGNNYLGVALETGFHPQLSNLTIGTLPWTDRMLCEHLPRYDSDLNAPWATIEFDSAFMTLHRGRDPDTGKTEVKGVMGRFANQERLFNEVAGTVLFKPSKNKTIDGARCFHRKALTAIFRFPRCQDFTGINSNRHKRPGSY